LAPEILYTGEVPLIPNVRPVLLVSGSDYEMGYQWFQQIAEVFGPFYLKRMKQGEFTEEQLGALKAYQWHFKKYTPEMVEYMKGMAAGATDADVPLSYMDVLARFTESGGIKANAPPGSEREKFPPEDCSGFAAWGSATKDGRLVAGGSGDHDLIGFPHFIGIRGRPFRTEYTIMFYPETGNNFIGSPPTGGHYHPLMNNRGVALVHHGCTGTVKTEELDYGVPVTVGYLHAIRFANSAIEAKDIVLSMPNCDGRLGGMWADTKGNAFVIENRDNPRCVRVPGDNDEVDFIYSTNNLLSKELGRFMEPPSDEENRDGTEGLTDTWPEGAKLVPHGGWFGCNLDIPSVSRNLMIWDMLHHYHGEVDLEFAKMLWRFPGKLPSYSTLEEADEAWSRTRGEGWHTHISTLQNAMVGVIKPDDGNGGLYYVSQGCATRMTSPFMPGGHYYRISPTYSFYELQLESGPTKVVEKARKRAQYDQYYANLELRKLNYGDVAFAPLDAIFNDAATEWQKGEFHRNLAMETSGDEAIARLAKALRAFTRCQALARQAYNALVPPPASPEDLGL